MSNSFVSEYSDLVDACLEKNLVGASDSYKIVVEAMRYSALNGGKRIRPAIMLMFYKLCGGISDGAVNFAAALEMIHTYSLIHDDLPCMDNDDLRRGKPSCHKAFPENIALLAGDALLTEAFALALKTKGIPEYRIIESLHILAECAGVNGMIGGQVIDLVNNGNVNSVETLTEMYNLKTGALIVAAVKIGTILGGGTNKQVVAGEKFAKNLGLAFQIIDDILDATGDEAELGKPVNSDAKNGKYTFVTALGVEACREKAKQLTKEAKEALNAYEGSKKEILELTEQLLNRTY